MDTEPDGHRPYECAPETCGGCAYDPCGVATSTELRRIESLVFSRRNRTDW